MTDRTLFIYDSARIISFRQDPGSFGCMTPTVYSPRTGLHLCYWTWINRINSALAVFSIYGMFPKWMASRSSNHEIDPRVATLGLKVDAGRHL